MAHRALSGLQAAHVIRVLAAGRRFGRPLLPSFAAAAAVDGAPEVRRLAASLAASDDTELLDGVERALAAGRDRPAAAMLTALRRAGLPAEGLDELARWLTGRATSRASVGRALIYPLAVLAVTVAVHALVLPRVMWVFGVLFEGLGAHLPWLTRVVLFAYGFGDVGPRFLVPLLWLGVLCALGIGLAILARAPHRSRLAAVAPITSGYVRAEAARTFTGVLALLLRWGTTLPEALRLAADAVENPALRSRLAELVEVAEGGEGVGELLRRSTALPAAVGWRLWSAYYRSALADELGEVARDCEREVAVQAEGATAGFRALAGLLVAVSLVPVPIAVVAMYMPMFNLISQIS